MTETHSRKEVSDALGISRQMVEKYIGKGLFKEIAPGRLILDDCRRAYETQTDPGKRLRVVETTTTPPPAPTAAGDEPEPGLFDFHEARTHRENWNAKAAELKYREAAGLLIPREEVAAKEFAVARKLRDRILGFPARLANFCPPDAMKIVTDECDQLVRELQDDAAQIASSR